MCKSFIANILYTVIVCISRNMEDDNMETMDFEEISDGELEEDIKTSGKGLGDALGVDWESLVKETQAKRTVSSNQDSAENRWQCKAIFYRIGISKKYAGEDFVKKLLKKYEKNGKYFLYKIETIENRGEFIE